LLREIVPGAKTIALLADSNLGAFPGLSVQNDARAAAAALGLQLIVLKAASEGEIQSAFTAVNQQRADAIVVPTSPFFMTRAKQIASLAAQHRVPAIYARREFAAAGGLMSYGYDVAEGYRQAGNYAGRILKGEKPAELPVFQPTRLQLILNLKTAEALDLTFPPGILAIADEVIE